MAKKKGTRANNGMGSVRQRNDGRWEARYTTPDGHQKSVYGKTEKEATTKLRTQLHAIDAGSWREPSRMTVNAWITIWLRDYQSHTTGRTVMTYTSTANNYIRPVIGNLRVSAVKPVHIIAVLSRMRNHGLSATTQRSTYSTISNLFRAAITAGIINTDPTNGVKLPPKSNKRFQFVDRAHIADFVNAASDTPYPNEILLMLYTGMRVGELRGLRWDDWNGTTLKIQRQLYAHAHNTGFGAPKYGEVRTIELPVEAVEVLRQQRVRQAEQRLAAGDSWNDTERSANLIFRQKTGNAHSNCSLARAVKKAGSAIGIPDLHPHDLRHSYAIAAIRSGADIKTVQHNLGHKSASVTLDVYAAYTTDAGKESAKKLSEYLKNAEKNAN